MTEDKKLVAFPKRKAILPSVRFEVFKRDSFTCQYCGKKAPDVILNADHIKPVADGGENEIVNLITSCVECNGGKGARPLDDHSIIEKQRRQLEELNERRNQLEMMLKWREGLQSLEGDYVQAIQNEFLRYGPWSANESGERNIASWIKRFGLQEILDAIGKSFPQYLEFVDGKPTSESWNKAFDMVPRIALAVKRGGPESGRVFYVRGIIRNKFGYGADQVVDLVNECLARGADIETIVQTAKTARSWTAFRRDLETFISNNEAE